MGSSWTVSFPTGASNTSFNIPIICDDIFEGSIDETIMLRLDVVPSFNARVMAGSMSIMTVNIIGKYYQDEFDNLDHFEFVYFKVYN